MHLLALPSLACSSCTGPEDAIRFARAEIADELVHTACRKSTQGSCWQMPRQAGQHSLSVAAFESASQLAEQGRYLVSSVLAARARAVAGREAGGDTGAGAAGGGQWSEAVGRQRLAEAVERMVGGGASKAEERAALGAVLLR